MKKTLFILIGRLFFGTQELQAQSLSIGGLNLRIGMKVDSLLRVIPQPLSMSFVEDNAYVIETAGEIIGHLTHRAGRLTEIIKYNNSPLGSVQQRYQATFNEFKQKTNTQQCSLTVTTIDESENRTFVRCGRYTLVSSLSSIQGVEHFFYILLK